MSTESEVCRLRTTFSIYHRRSTPKPGSKSLCHIGRETTAQEAEGLKGEKAGRGEAAESLAWKTGTGFREDIDDEHTM